MKAQRHLSYLFVACLALAIWGCDVSGSEPVAAHVIVLGIDGLSPAGVQKATTPNFNRVIAGGAYTFSARAVLGTSSSQNWASMIMGAGPEQHGITSNGWERNSHAIKPTATGLEDIFPTIFGLVREQLPAAKTASIYDWGGFGRLYEKSAVDVDKNPKGPRATMAEVVQLLNEEIPTFTFIHLDHVDGALHGAGHGSDPYFTAVELADSLLGNLLSVLDAKEAFAHTTLIISSDHGGIGTRHGGESMDELEIPWMAYGAGVKKGKQIVDPVDTYDTAATAAYVLGLNQPYAWIARPVVSAFEGGNDHVVAATSPYAPAPRIHPPIGELREDGLEVALSVDHQDAAIHYSLDGSIPDADAPRYASPIALTDPVLLNAITFTEDGGQSVVSTAEYLTPDNGVSFSYFTGAWQKLPDFATLRPVSSGRVKQFDLTAVHKRADFYSILFDAYLQVDAAGTYTFELMADDGAMLWVNREAIVDLNGTGGARTETGSIELAVGRHHVLVGYLETYGDNVLNVQYAGPDFEMQQIPARVLYTTP